MIGVGPAIPEELPGLAHLVDETEIQVGRNCVTAPSSAGRQLYVARCTGAYSQRWNFQSDGTVRSASGYCMDVDGASRQGGSNPELKKSQLRELLTQYGPIEFIWFDHAIGDGGLGHAETAAFVKSLQPDCFVGYNHGDQTGADIRLGERGRHATGRENVINKGCSAP